MKPVTKLGLRRGSIIQAAAAQYGYGYYTGTSPDQAVNIRRYAQGISATARNIVGVTNEVHTLRDIHDTYGKDDAVLAWNLVTGRQDAADMIKPSLLRLDKDAEQRAITSREPANPPNHPTRHFALVEVTGPGASARPLGTIAHATYHPDSGWTWV
jgi:hypothetical protein